MELVIHPSDCEKCMEISITDDDLALEGDEMFEVALEAPKGVTSTSPNVSRVTIINDDGILIDSLCRNEENIFCKIPRCLSQQHVSGDTIQHEQCCLCALSSSECQHHTSESAVCVH